MQTRSELVGLVWDPAVYLTPIGGLVGVLPGTWTRGMSFSTHGSTPGSERASGSVADFTSGFRGCGLYRPVEVGGEGHHDSETAQRGSSRQPRP